jgi:exopolyphosphatase/guanosine-5'-triphosphate,3'-diphosphate pyrophosphatase
MQPMTNLEESVRRAVIDVGTNSVKLLVADVGQTLTPVCKMSQQTRLGEGFFRTGRLQDGSIARTVAALAELAARAKEFRPLSLRVLATSATREAANREEFIQAVFQATGLRVEVISVEEEAEYIFRGVTSNPEIGTRPVLIVDVGGGSTEWIVGEDGFTRFTQSTSLGTARLLEQVPPQDPPTRQDLANCRRVVAEVLITEVKPVLQPVLAASSEREVCLVGLGGACRSLVRLAAAGPPATTTSVHLRADRIREQVEQLWGLSTQQRQNLEGIKPEKADVILAGAVIFEAVLNQFNFHELIRSGKGLRTGVLLLQAAQSATPPLSVQLEVPASAPPSTSLAPASPE